MHHPGHRDAIPSLLDASQRDDDWAIRHSSMVRRCSELLRLVERSDSPTGVELWRERLWATERWTE
jgi:hypothetical protein